MANFVKWLVKVLIGIAKYEDKNRDGIVEVSIKYNIQTGKIDWGVK